MAPQDLGQLGFRQVRLLVITCALAKSHSLMTHTALSVSLSGRRAKPGVQSFALLPVAVALNE